MFSSWCAGTKRSIQGSSAPVCTASPSFTCSLSSLSAMSPSLFWFAAVVVHLAHLGLAVGGCKPRSRARTAALFGVWYGAWIGVGTYAQLLRVHLYRGTWRALYVYLADGACAQACAQLTISKSPISLVCCSRTGAWSLRVILPRACFA